MLQIGESITGMSYWQEPRDILFYSRLASAPPVCARGVLLQLTSGFGAPSP